MVRVRPNRLPEVRPLRKDPKAFEPPISKTTGEPCRNCIRQGSYCRAHAKALLTFGSKSRLSRLPWQDPYLDALRGGHTKRAAAGLAGISHQRVDHKCAQDPSFAEEVEVAYAQGTAYLESLADDRATDPNKPSDRVLIHLLSTRPDHGAKMEVSGPGGGPIELASSPIPLERLSLEGRRKILQVFIEEGLVALGEDEDVIDLIPERANEGG